MVTVSCSGKFHAFALAEQMERHGLLDSLFTSYAFQKNTLARHFVKRVDKEMIAASSILTSIPLAICMKLRPGSAYVWNDLFDRQVALRLQNKSSVFVGWSGMSLHSLRKARGFGMVTILERGSSHISYQDHLLREEYERVGLQFSIDQRVIEKELQEYQEADFISIPSTFVKNSFLEMGVAEEKLLVNPYGASSYFKNDQMRSSRTGRKFRVLYLGTLSVRKGLIYLFEALLRLNLPTDSWEAWFIGSVDEEMKPIIARFKTDNWVFHGKIDHYSLRDFLSQCDIGVQPSVEEGLSMVIPQMLSCGIPVIASKNTGGEDIISESKTGFTVPIRNAESIAQKIEWSYNHPQELAQMKEAAAASIRTGYTWNDYGDRYASTIKGLVAGKSSLPAE